MLVKQLHTHSIDITTYYSLCIVLSVTTVVAFGKLCEVPLYTGSKAKVSVQLCRLLRECSLSCIIHQSKDFDCRTNVSIKLKLIPGVHGSLELC